MQQITNSTIIREDNVMTLALVSCKISGFSVPATRDFIMITDLICKATTKVMAGISIHAVTPRNKDLLSYTAPTVLSNAFITLITQTVLIKM